MAVEEQVFRQLAAERNDHGTMLSHGDNKVQTRPRDERGTGGIAPAKPWANGKRLLARIGGFRCRGDQCCAQMVHRIPPGFVAQRAVKLDGMVRDLFEMRQRGVD